jgi:hypothetical protein
MERAELRKEWDKRLRETLGDIDDSQLEIYDVLCHSFSFEELIEAIVNYGFGSGEELWESIERLTNKDVATTVMHTLKELIEK